MTFSVRIPLPEYQAVDYAHWSYTLNREDIEDGVNKVGMRVCNPVFDTLLCSTCDQPVRDHRCDNCGLVFLMDARPLGDGFWRVEL